MPSTEDIQRYESQALAELAQEDHRQAVNAAKVRIRERRSWSLWKRLMDALPFTITWKD